MLQYLSSRELALVIWIGVFICAICLFKGIRTSIGSFLRSLFHKKVSPMLLLLILFTIGIAIVLDLIGFWEPAFVKDAVFWFFGFVFTTFLTLNDGDEEGYFKGIVKGIFKLTILSEFILNFYTFSLAWELILLPVLVLLTATKAFSERDKKNKDATVLLTRMLTIASIFYFGYALYETIAGYRELFTVLNLKELILPCVLSISILPAFYLIAVYIQYGELFVRTDRLTRHMGAEKRARKAVLLAAGISLSKLAMISKRMNKSSMHHASDLNTYFKGLTK